MDRHQSEMSYPDPLQSEKADPDSHQSVKPDPDTRRSKIPGAVEAQLLTKVLFELCFGGGLMTVLLHCSQKTEVCLYTLWLSVLCAHTAV
jgi:hypothetical protein